MSETLPAFRNFLSLTKDVNAAMSLTKLATNIAESGFSDVAGAAQLLSSVLAGQGVRSLKDFGINIRESADGTIDAGEALARLYQRFTDANSAIADTQNQLDILNGRWETFTRLVGQATAVTVNFLVDATIETKKFFRDVPEMVLVAALKVQGVLTGIAGAVGEAFNFKKIAFEGSKGIAEAFDRGMASVQPAIDAIRANVRDKDVAEAAKSGEAQGKAEAAARALAIKIAGQKKTQEDAEAAEKAALEAAKSRVAEYMQLARQRTAAEVAAWEKRMELLEVGRELEQRATDEHLAEQKEIAEEQQRLAQEQADLLIEYLQLELETNELTIRGREETLQRILELEKQRRLATEKNAEKRAMIEQIYEKKSLQLAKMTSKQKLQLAVSVAQDLVSGLSGIFGQNKALAIAQTIISTITAVMRAYEIYGPTPLGYAMSAAMAAIGAVQVHKIRTTQFGGSGGGGGGGGRGTFDDPINDRIAMVGSRKSAEDFVRIAQEGIAQGLRAGFGLPPESGSGGGGAQGGSTVYITIHGMYGGDSGLRQLRRMLERSERLDRSRRLR